MEIKIKGYTTKNGTVVKGFTKNMIATPKHIGKDLNDYYSVKKLKKRMDLPHCLGNYKHSCAKDCKYSASCFMLTEKQKQE